MTVTTKTRLEEFLCMTAINQVARNVVEPQTSSQIVAIKKQVENVHKKGIRSLNAIAAMTSMIVCSPCRDI
jgi:hypothetical protein